MAFFLKLSYSKVRASFAYLGRGLMSTPRAIYSPLHVCRPRNNNYRYVRTCSLRHGKLFYTRNTTALGSLIRPRAVTRCNLAVSDMYMRDFGNTHQIAYTYCSVGISDLKPLTGTSADQLPHRKSRSLATA